jgi:purine-binding chemotaxis protein CheW
MDEKKKILSQRAKLLAQKRIQADIQSEDHIAVVQFGLSCEHYAIASKFIAEVLPLKEMNVLPGLPVFILGIVHVRGRILSVVNLKTILLLKEKGITQLNRLIILKNETMEFAVVVDQVMGHSLVNIRELRPVPENLLGEKSKFIMGLTGDGAILLNGDNILNDKSLIVNQKEPI